ncbi:acyl-CoA thioesterase [Streptomyces chartreusis]|uniref:acyl-CoA thioesterase n=1 Tax=Streptomyces chartreusis TaxID=1969 RepID=UPI003812EFBF
MTEGVQVDVILDENVGRLRGEGQSGDHQYDWYGLSAPSAFDKRRSGCQPREVLQGLHSQIPRGQRHMPRNRVIDQLASIESAQILSEAPDSIWVDASKRMLFFRVPEELASSDDGHLGYTQLLRVCEIARDVFWRELIPQNVAIVGCIVAHLEMVCRQRVTVGTLVEIESRLISLGRTSFTVMITFTGAESGIELTNFRLTLVALGCDGQSIPVRKNGEHY